MRIGVLGYGSIGKRHFVNIENLGHETFWWDPNIPSHGDREKIINYCDAIVVASPSINHAKDLMDVIDQGRPVLVEKPFGYDGPALLEGYLKGARRRWGPSHIIATGFNLRFHECVKKAKELLPEIGEIIAAHFTVYQKTEKPEYLRDGIIRNWCSHEIDLAQYLFGPGIVNHCSTTFGVDGRDTIDALIGMDFPSVEGSVIIQADYYTDPEQRFFWISGTKGTIYVDLVKRSVFFRDREGHPRPILSASDSWDKNYFDEIALFIQSIEAGKHLAPLATGEDGVSCLYRIMEAREKAGLNG